MSSKIGFRVRTVSTCSANASPARGVGNTAVMGCVESRECSPSRECSYFADEPVVGTYVEGKKGEHRLLGRAHTHMPLYESGERFRVNGQEFIVRQSAQLSPRGDGWQIVEPVLPGTPRR